MKVARPTVSEERWLEATARYPALRAHIDALGHGGQWKSTTPLARVLGVVLTLVGMSLLGGALSAFPSPWFVAGLLLMLGAELLIARRRMYRSGIEEVMYLCGAVAVVAQILDWSGGDGDAIGLALISTAVLLVGWRLLNPVVTTLAAAGYSLAIALIDTRFLDGNLRTLQAAIWCALLALLALAAGGRRWQRPAHDFMLDGLVMVMPWLGGAWLMAHGWRDGSRHGWALAASLVFFSLLLAMGLRRRQHAPLTGALGCLACALWAVHRLVHWPLYGQLIVSGTLLLVVAAVADRRLRKRKHGFTSDEVEGTPGLDLAQLGGAAGLSPGTAAQQPAGFGGQGGGFGGGGASGRY